MSVASAATFRLNIWEKTSGQCEHMGQRTQVVVWEKPSGQCGPVGQRNTGCCVGGGCSAGAGRAEGHHPDSKGSDAAAWGQRRNQLFQVFLALFLVNL